MPYDEDFPDDCNEEECECICPDPDRDQPTLGDCMADIDTEDMTDGDSGNDLTPFFIDIGADEISVNGTRYAYTATPDGISFTKGGQTRKVEWGWRGTPSSKAPWNPTRVSFDGGDVVTIGPA